MNDLLIDYDPDNYIFIPVVPYRTHSLEEKHHHAHARIQIFHTRRAQRSLRSTAEKCQFRQTKMISDEETQSFTELQMRCIKVPPHNV